MAVRASVTALGPPDHREHPVTHLPQPGALLAGGEVHVCLGPAAGPVVLWPVELRAAEPVLQGQIETVTHAHQALLGRVDHEQATERPERLPAQGNLWFLVEHDHRLACVRNLRGRDQARQPCPHNNDIGVHDNGNPGAIGLLAAPGPRNRESHHVTRHHRPPLCTRLAVMGLAACHVPIFAREANHPQPPAGRSALRKSPRPATGPRLRRSRTYVGSVRGSITSGCEHYRTGRAARR